MKTIEQEAEEYFPLLDITNDRTGETEEENLQILGHRRSFIVGANSKYVQAEKIKAQIKIYQSLLDQCENHNAAICKYMIKKRDVLEQQLRQLEEDENRR
jgi:hypothetical protein